MTATVLYSRMVDTLGAEIVSGQLAPGSTLTLDGIQVRFGVSRTVARDCMRTLESIRLVASKRRTGIEIRPVEQWNVFDRRVIRWRLDSDRRPEQLQSLTELRLGIEPFAANLAASRATEEELDALRQAAGEMRVFGETGRLDRYLAADIEFHSIVLRSSRNEFYAALVQPVIEAVLERPLQGRGHAYPVPQAIDDHEAVMLAISRGESAAAENAMLHLLSDVRVGIGVAVAESQGSSRRPA